ncbi:MULTISPECIES: hypothetical protein [unclassified Streptomyces]|uniref:hypothetical protein n=1 Tax=unclassified Streptomyces TaxID=2593676 RepID=UPI003870B7D3|nr:hypothetical protein OG569_15055 [Streptomyces sp. NBC_00827]
MTAGRCSRALRAAVFAAVCVLSAVQGHAMASGFEVPWWALVAGAVATGGTAWALAGRERGLFAVGSVTVAAQVLLHSLFSLAQAVVRPEGADGASLAGRWASYLLCSPAGTGTDTHGGQATAAHSMSHDMADMSSMSMSGMDGMGSMGSMGSMAHAGHVMDGMSPMGMLAAHLVTALLCGLWLAHGERAAFRILRVLAGWLVAPLRLLLRLPTPPHRPRVRARRNHSVHALRQLLLVHAITSRGPPVGTAVI